MTEFSQQTLSILADAALRSLLIAVMIGIALAVFRARNPQLRHRTWTAVLLGMLAMPALVVVLPGWRTPIAEFAWPALARSSADGQATEADRLAMEGRTTLERRSDGAANDDHSPMAGTMDLGQPSSHGEQPNEAPTAAEPAANVGPTEGESSSNATPTAFQDTTSGQANASAFATGGASRRTWSAALPFVLVGYLAICVIMLARLCVGLVIVRRLARDGRVIDRPNGIEVLSTERIAVPVTFGWLRPRILVPPHWGEWSEDKRNAVLRHELEHVARQDSLVTLLAELNRCLCWFHPLAWFLCRRLAVLAEQCCDDAVLNANAPRTSYARYLLEIAANVSDGPGRVRAPQVAMAREPDVAARIRQILDASRLPSTQPRRGLIAVLFLLSAGIILTVATARGDAEQDSANNGSSSADEAPNSLSATADAQPSGPQAARSPRTAASSQTAGSWQGPMPIPEEYQGEIKAIRIEDEDGAPVPGADVYVAVEQYNSLAAEQCFYYSKEVSGADGVVRIQVPNVPSRKVQMDSGTGLSQFVRELPRLVVIAKDHPPYMKPIERFESQYTVRLAKNVMPIQGHIVDLEGKPVADARVRVAQIWEPSRGADIAQWAEDAKHNSPTEDRDVSQIFRDRDNGVAPRNALFPKSWQLRIKGLPSERLETATNQDGRFELQGFLPDSLVVLEMEHPDYVKTHIEVVAREMEPVNHPSEYSAPWKRTQMCYGAKFDYFAEPCQVVRGVVRDVDSGEPIPHARVVLALYSGVRSSSANAFIETVADERGEYAMHGLPQVSRNEDRGHTLRAIPPRDAPYFSLTAESPADGGLEPVTLDFALKRGAWITGKLVDRDTGRGVKGIVNFYPLLSNQHVSDYPNFRRGARRTAQAGHRTEDDGTFRIPAIPGEGILTAVGERAERFQVAAGAVEAGWPTEEAARRPFDAPRFAVEAYTPAVFNSVKRLEIPADTATLHSDIEIIPMQSQTVELVDPQGEPVAGVNLTGTHPIFLFGNISVPAEYIAVSGDARDTASIEFFGLEVDGRRMLVAFHRGRRLGIVTPVIHNETRQVTLQPLATIRGRLVDEQGQPIAGTRVVNEIPESELTVPSSNPFVRTAISQSFYYTPTDENGNFEIRYVIPGALYQLKVSRQTVATTDVIKPGEEINLGDVTFTRQ